MIEVQFQKKLIDWLEDPEIGGFGKKLSHRTLVGIPDLFMQAPGLPSMVVEIKMEKKNDLSKAKVVNVDMTPLQRKFIRDVQASGGYSGWIVGVPIKPGLTFAVCGSSPEATSINPDVFFKQGQYYSFDKARGPYSIFQCLKFIRDEIDATRGPL